MKTTRLSQSDYLALAIGATVIVVSADLAAADWPQWRGPQRNGVAAATETGLLKSWPADGPKLRWQMKDCGTGYSTPAVVGDRIYLLGNEGLDNEFVQARAAADGKVLWQTRLGKVGNPNQKPNFPAARSTPTVDGALLYALGSDGDLACLETGSGKVLWQKSFRSNFGGKPGQWAYAESPLIDGGTLVCTPGGSEATLLALNKKTGDPIWKCAVPGGEEAAYTSAIAVETGGVKQYVQMLQKGLVGADARTGKILWRYSQTVSKYGATIPSPLARNGFVYSGGSGTGGGLVKLVAGGGGVQAEPVYFSPKLPTAIGGAVLVGDYLYGTSRGMLCAEFASGELKWEERALGPAALCYADGRLYLHAESGEVALVEPSPEGYQEISRFTPPEPAKRSQQMEKAWAYPVVANGCLYIRDHQALWCYDVKQP